MNIGERLQLLRTQRVMSERALAIKAGLVPSQINKIEHNLTKPSLDSLERICQALDISISDFFASDISSLDPDLKRLLDTANKLTPKQRKLFLELMDSYLK